MKPFFGLRWRGKPLEDWTIAKILHHQQRSGIRGGTEVSEKARVAWALGETLPEFEDRPMEQQEWAIATWRVERKMEAIGARELFDSRGK